ncbi:MAG: isochorismatase family protein [Coraliomargarita sp.]
MSDPINHLGLLVIDLQDAFLKAIPNQDSLLKRCSFAIDAAKLLGAKLAVTEQIPQKLGPTNAKLAARLPENTPVFDKSAFSALRAEGVTRWIETSQLDHLLIIGIETPICIYQTAVDALGNNTGVTLLSDCIGERRPEDRAPVLQQLLSMEAHVLPSETIFYSLLGDASHPDFRAYTELVKRYN